MSSVDESRPSLKPVLRGLGVTTRCTTSISPIRSITAVSVVLIDDVDLPRSIRDVLSESSNVDDAWDPPFAIGVSAMASSLIGGGFGSRMSR
jgi:hypothetical protein